MRDFLDYLKIDEKIVFEKLEFQLGNLVGQARFLGFLAFEQEFLVKPLLQYVREKSRMPVRELNAETATELFSAGERLEDVLYVPILRKCPKQETEALFRLPSVKQSLGREWDFNVFWILNHGQIVSFSSKHRVEMQNNCFIRVLYDKSLLLASEHENRLNAVRTANYRSETPAVGEDKDALQISLERANRLVNDGAYPEAEQAYLALIGQCGADSRLDLASKAKANLGLVYKLLGESDRALKWMGEQLETDLKLGNHSRVISGYGNQAAVLADEGRYLEALRLLDLKETLARKCGDSLQLSDAFNNRATIYVNMGRLGPALEILDEMESICLELGFKQNLSACYSNRALIHGRLGDYDRMLSELLKEEKVLLETEDGEGLLKNWDRLADIYLRFGSSGKAIELLELCANRLLAQNQKGRYSDFLGKLAAASHESGDDEKALTLLADEEAIKNELGLQKELAANKGRLAMIHCSLSNFDEAATALAEKEKLDDPENTRAASENLRLKAKILILGNQTEEALPLVEEELAFHRKNADELGMADCYFLLAEIHFKQGNLESAKSFLHLQIPIEDKYHRTSSGARAFRLLAKVTKSMLCFDDALAYNRHAEKLENHLKRSRT